VDLTPNPSPRERGKKAESCFASLSFGEAWR